MRLFVGLGNPGAKYQGHRHNIGFIVVDEIARRHGFAPWRRRFQGETAEGTLERERVILLKPMTYMNDSGQSVGEAANYFKLPLSDIVVFHDELDLPRAKLRVKVGGGTAGHNGLRSLDTHVGNEFRRVRIGIGHPGHKDRVTSWVLGKPGADDEASILRAISDADDVLPLAVSGDFNEAMKRLHTSR